MIARRGGRRPRLHAPATSPRPKPLPRWSRRDRAQAVPGGGREPGGPQGAARGHPQATCRSSSSAGSRPTICSRGCDAGAAGFGLGSGLYKPGQSAADTADKARAYVAGLGAMKPIKIAILGFGKIAARSACPVDRRQSALSNWSRPRADRARVVAQAFTDWRELIRTVEGLEAVAITTPPGPRYEIARECILAGLHCLLEKPPTAGLAEIADLACLAEAQQVSSVHHLARAAPSDGRCRREGARRQAHHSRWQIHLARRRHKWHPGQHWIWEPGGFGVFDPGINAFSIATKIFPGGLFVQVRRPQRSRPMPRRRSRPRSTFASPQADGPLTASLDWRRTEGEEWTIAVETADGTRSAAGRRRRRR